MYIFVNLGERHMALSTLFDGLEDHLREAGALLRHAILPLYRNDRKGLPASVSSAVLMQLGTRKVLVSAAHALAAEPGHDARIFLLEGGTSGDPLQRNSWLCTTPRPGSHERDSLDIGIVPLDDETAARIPMPLFLNSGHCVVRPISGRRPLVAIGYPSTRQDRNVAAREYTVRPYVYCAFEAPAAAYSALAHDGISPDTHLLIQFDQSRPVDLADGRRPPKPTGMSGGGVWLLGNVLTPVTPDNLPKLAAIITEARPAPLNVMIAVRATVIMNIVADGIAGPRQSAAGRSTLHASAQNSPTLARG